MKILVLNLAHLPNEEGFKFTGVGLGGRLYPMEVAKNTLGQFYVMGYGLLIGWLRNDDNVLIK